jgi:hypothetical protein
VRKREVWQCAIAAWVACSLGCGVPDRTLQERSDSGVERGRDGGPNATRGGGGLAGRDRDGGRSGAGGEGSGGTGTGPGGRPCDPPCQGSKPTCDDCPPARVSGALVGVGAVLPETGALRLRAHGFAALPRVCRDVQGRVLCVSGGIEP